MHFFVNLLFSPNRLHTFFLNVCSDNCALYFMLLILPCFLITTSTVNRYLNEVKPLNFIFIIFTWDVCQYPCLSVCMTFVSIFVTYLRNKSFKNYKFFKYVWECNYCHSYDRPKFLKSFKVFPLNFERHICIDTLRYILEH